MWLLGFFVLQTLPMVQRVQNGNENEVINAKRPDT